jgi:hypothetical protein
MGLGTGTTESDVDCAALWDTNVTEQPSTYVVERLVYSQLIPATDASSSGKQQCLITTASLSITQLQSHKRSQFVGQFCPT